MRIERLPSPQLDGWNPKTLTQLRPDMMFYFASRRPLASEAPFDQFKSTCPGTSIIGGAKGGQVLDHQIADDEVAAVGASLKATNASFAI
jgi:hypothetical protein